MNPLLQELLQKAGRLSLGLQSLRQAADAAPLGSLLLEWARKHLKLSAASEPEWFRRAWWGLAAGELVRAYLYDPALRQQVLDLIVEPDWSELEAARRTHGGVILAAAHIGPPKTAMNFLISRNLPLMIWTNTHDLPAWTQKAFPVAFVDPVLDRSSLTRTALHLRNRGVLFGAPDVSRGQRTVTLARLDTLWSFALGIPALARMLELPVFRFFALWNEDHLRIECERLVPPEEGLPDDAWDRQWIENFWCHLEPIVRSSPENLRFLLFVHNGAIRRELGL